MRQWIGRGTASFFALMLIGLVAACAGTHPSTSAAPTGSPGAGSPGAGSSAAPSTDPSGGPGSTQVVLETATANVVTLDINDASATVIEAHSGVPGDGASVEPYTVRVTNDDPSTLRLIWVGGPCDARDTLTIDAAARQFLLVQPECSGDAVAFDRILILRFSSPVDAGDVQAILQDGTDT
jgi:hypothetical protein